MQKIKKDDLVVVIAGKDKDKQGKVLSVDTKKNKVVVEGCNMITKHTKQSPEMCIGDRGGRFGPSGYTGSDAYQWKDLSV